MLLASNFGEEWEKSPETQALSPPQVVPSIAKVQVMFRATFDKLPICKPPHKQHLIFLIVMVVLVTIPVTQLITAIIPVTYGVISGEGAAALTGTGEPSRGARAATSVTIVAEKTLLLILPILIAIRYGRPLSRKILGLQDTKIGALLFYGLGGAVFIVIVVKLYAMAFSLTSASDKALLDAKYGADFFTNLCLTFSVVALAPAAEEILFRGFLQRTVRDYAARFISAKLAVWVGLAATAFTFGSFHLGEEQQKYFAVYAFFGFLCGYLYELTGDLRVSTLLHAGNNAYAMLSFSGISHNFISIAMVLICVVLAIVFVNMAGRYIGDRDQDTGMEPKKPRVV